MHIHTDEIAAAHTDYLKQHTALSVKQLLDSYKCGLVLLVLPLFLLSPPSCLPGTLQWKARGLCVKRGQVDLIMFILSDTLLLQPPCIVKYISACVPYGLSCCHNKVVSPLGRCPVLYVSPLLDFTACKKVVPVRKGGRAVAMDSTTGCEYHF